HNHDGDQLDRVRHQRDDAAGEHLVDVLDVVGHAGEQPADRHPVVEGGPPGDDVPVGGQPERVHRALAEELQRVELGVAGQRLQHYAGDVDRRERQEPVGLVGGDVDVD